MNHSVLLGSLLAVCAGVVAAQSLENLLAEAASVREFKRSVISPDGKKVAWVEEIGPKRNAIYVSEMGGAPVRITAGPGPANEPEAAWSMDSRRLAFLSDAPTPGQLNVFIVSIDGKAPRRISTLKGVVTSPRWSPDGKQIAILYTENAAKEGGATAPAAREVGVIEAKIDEQRIALINAAQGGLRMISPADLYVYEYDWSPDGKRFAAIAAKGSGDNNWFIAQLYTIKPSTIERKSAQVTTILKSAMQIAVPRWSPDGKSIAFIGGLMSDAGVVGGEIFTVAGEGGEPRNLTPGMKMSASGLEWMPSSRRIVFSASTGGGSGIASLDLASGQIETQWQADESIKAGGDSPLSLSADGKSSAMIRSSWDRAPEVWAGGISSWKQVTHRNQDRKRTWGGAKNLTWKSEGMNVQGWVLFPAHYDPKQRYPMVVVVHGGPSSSKKPNWPDASDYSLLSAQGFFVLMPNPRGSYGQGETFTRANVRDFGGGDLRDVLAGVDEVLKTLPVDARRVGITGWSYGGYMTMWAVTQTGRFRAAVAGAGISNWKSYTGQNSIDQWMKPFFGASVYDDPAVYAKSSPIEFIKQVKTPTLVLVGERDAECPAPQSYEFWHALKALGAPTQLVVYDGEGHHFDLPEHRLDRMRRTIDWFRQYMK